MLQSIESLDDPGEEPRRLHASDVAIFVAGQSAGFVAAIPLAVELGSALVFAAVGFYVLTRVLLLTGTWWLQRRRAERGDSEVFITRQSALEGARGIFHFGEVVNWALILLAAWGSLLTPVPFAAAVFLAGWCSMIASYIYVGLLGAVRTRD